MSDMKDKFEDIKDNVKEYAHKAGEDMKQTGEAAKEKFSEVKDQVKSGFDQTMADVMKVTADDRNKAVLMHVLSIFFGLLPSLIFYFALGDSSEFLKEEAKNDLNFQITLIICYAVSSILVLLIIGLFLMMALGICCLIFEILALLKAKDGEHYKFPLSFNLIK
ncbi:MAG: DUF4870 domain-containing protein [Fusobacteriales bacterium]|jgi:uncharacterized Tic20 family protein|nr:DUF4870 domain-containing protein [Fusobacteriales bacterium]